MKRWRIGEFENSAQAQEWLDRLEQEKHNLALEAVTALPHVLEGVRVLLTVSYEEEEER